MFERYTDRARRSIVLAQENARMLNHNYIGTEHLLLGLVHEDGGVAAKVLQAKGVTLDAARAQVEQRIGPGQQAPSGHIPFTPRTRRVQELALREALHLGHNYVGTEHILLGLIREGEGVGAQILIALGAPLDDVRAKTLELLGTYAEHERSPATSGTSPVATVYVAPRTTASHLAEICDRLARIEQHLGITDKSAGAA